MKRHHFLLPLVLLAAGCAVTGTSLQHMDLNADGVIARGEFTDAVANASFNAYDRNHDGFIELNEWRSAEGGNEALFRLRDMSHNGRISPQEARLAAEKNGSLLSLFASIDSNHDGYIDSAEARRYRSAKR